MAISGKQRVSFRVMAHPLAFQALLTVSSCGPLRPIMQILPGESEVQANAAQAPIGASQLPRGIVAVIKSDCDGSIGQTAGFGIGVSRPIAKARSPSGGCLIDATDWRLSACSAFFQIIWTLPRSMVYSHKKTVNKIGRIGIFTISSDFLERFMRCKWCERSGSGRVKVFDVFPFNRFDGWAIRASSIVGRSR